MTNREVKRQIEQFYDVYKRTTEAVGSNLFLQSHWAKYMCILAAGFIENAHELLFSDFVSKAPKPIADFAQAQLSKIQNPKPSRFIETITQFKPEWGIELEAFLSVDGRNDAMLSIMNQRHNIAHGKNSNITVSAIKQYFDKSVEVLEYLEELLTS